MIAGSKIGTDMSGLLARPNGHPSASRIGGILIESGADGTRIGTNADGVSDALERDLIAANLPHGLIFAARSAQVAGNWIGLDATGLAPLGNDVGVAILPGDGDDNVIGTNGDGNGDALEGNVISGNLRWGVMIDGRGSTLIAANNRIAGNRFGFGADGVTAVGQQIAVYLLGRTDGTLVGSDGNGTSDALEVNHFGNNNAGLLVQVASGFSNTARCNLFGRDSKGAPAPNDFAVDHFTSDLVLEGNYLHYSRQWAARQRGGTLSLPAGNHNVISCNNEGLDNFALSPVLPAPDIWWGRASGPSGFGPGTGDSISGNVDPRRDRRQRRGHHRRPALGARVPTLGEWGAGVLALLLAGFSWLAFGARRGQLGPDSHRTYAARVFGAAFWLSRRFGRQLGSPVALGLLAS